MIGAGVPVTPDGDEGREWAERELADPAYRASEPTGFDRAMQAIAEWFGSLFTGDAGATAGTVLAVVLLVVVIALVVAGLLIWGMPRLARRRARTADVGALGDAGISPARYRREAESAAAEGDWAGAITARVRAIARALEEQEVVALRPGSTVQTFASSAAVRLPDHRAALLDAARSFDRVRYLGLPGDEPAYLRVCELDRVLAAAAVAAGRAQPVPA